MLRHPYNSHHHLGDRKIGSLSNEDVDAEDDDEDDALRGRRPVVCLVTWPLNGSEAGVDLVLIQTSLL